MGGNWKGQRSNIHLRGDTVRAGKVGRGGKESPRLCVERGQHRFATLNDGLSREAERTGSK